MAARRAGARSAPFPAVAFLVRRCRGAASAGASATSADACFGARPASAGAVPALVSADVPEVDAVLRDRLVRFGAVLAVDSCAVAAALAAGSPDDRGRRLEVSAG